jgi:predicted aspartyl protease
LDTPARSARTPWIRRPDGLAVGLLAVVLLLPACSSGSDDPPGAADPAAAPRADVPIDTDFGLVLLDVSVNGGEPRTFLLDTGFEFSVIDAGVAADLGLSVSDPDTIPQPGGPVEVGLVAGVRLGLPGDEFAPRTLRALPIAAGRAVIGREFAGILGHDVLAERVWVIDYEGRRLRTYPASFEPEVAGAEIPVEVVAAEPFVPAEIEQADGRRIPGRFKLDTGSTDVAGLNRNYLRDSTVLEPGQATLPVPGVAVGGETSGILFRVAAFRFGPHVLPRPVIGATLSSGGFEDRADAGTIGGELLRRFTLTLDYPRNRILLEPNGLFDAPVREDLSGIFLLRAEGARLDTVVVSAVTPGSPAAEADIREGDLLLAVDGVPVSRLGVAAIYERLRTGVGETRILLVLRDGETMEVPLALRPML